MALFICSVLIAQNNTIVIQQNSQSQNQPVKEKIVYQDRVVYVEKPQSGVVCIYGYLYVYPMDLGKFGNCSFEAIISKINQKKSYGHSNWRLPTAAEVELMKENRNKIPDFGSALTGGCRPGYWTQELVQSLKKDDPYNPHISGWCGYPTVRLVCE